MPETTSEPVYYGPCEKCSAVHGGWEACQMPAIVAAITRNVERALAEAGDGAVTLYPGEARWLLAALAQDKARLDWLEGNAILSSSMATSGEVYQRIGWRDYARQSFPANAIRAAIDAAAQRAAGPGEASARPEGGAL